MQKAGFSGTLFEIVRNDGFYMVMCDFLLDEYVRVADRECLGSGSLVKHILDSLRKESIIEWAKPVNQSTAKAGKQKDQPVVDCAIEGEKKAHILVTEDTNHFMISWPRDPVLKVIGYRDFIDKHQRENICSDCKQGRFH